MSAIDLGCTANANDGNSSRPYLSTLQSHMSKGYTFFTGTDPASADPEFDLSCRHVLMNGACHANSRPSSPLQKHESLHGISKFID